MFNRTADAARLPPPEPQLNRAADAGQARRPSPSKAPTLIAHGLTIQGALNGDGEVHVDGVVHGEVHVQRLVVGEFALVEGTVLAESVEIRGRVAGTVTARTIRLYPTAKVQGDLTCDQFAVELGATFEGRCTKPVESTSLATTPRAEVVEQADLVPSGIVTYSNGSQPRA